MSSGDTLSAFDWDMIRTILLVIDENENISKQALMSELKNRGIGWTETICYTNMLLESNLVYYYGDIRGSAASVFVQRPTFEGFELLNAMRNDEIWAEVKDLASENGISLTSGLILDASKAISLRKMGLSVQNSSPRPKNTESKAKNA